MLILKSKNLSTEVSNTLCNSNKRQYNFFDMIEDK